MFNKIYIYCHVDRFCSPQYVGIGVYGRAWEQKKRDKTHKNWLEQQTHNYVEIWDSNIECRDEARLKERGYIRAFDPRFNINERIK